MKPLHIDTINQLLRLVGMEQDQKHPLLYIIRVEKLRELPLHFPIDYSMGFYVIGLIRNIQGAVECGRRSYDFQRGTMFFLGPNQLVGHTLEALAEAEGWMLFLHRAYLSNHPLQEQILDYGFFDYTVTEALHLSKKEEDTMDQIFQNINIEYGLPIDKYSRRVIISNFELLLSYANRYYGRQFTTRNEIESSFLMEFERLLRNYFLQNDLEKEGIPTIAFFAQQLHMSEKYLSDKLKTISGKTAQEHIYLKLIEEAKVLLRQERLPIAKVAYQLGFEYPQYFSRFFKKRVGLTPKAYRVLS